MQIPSGVALQCAGIFTGKVSVQTLDAAGSVGEARRLLMRLTGQYTLFTSPDKTQRQSTLLSPKLTVITVATSRR